MGKLCGFRGSPQLASTAGTAMESPETAVGKPGSFAIRLEPIRNEAIRLDEIRLEAIANEPIHLDPIPELEIRNEPIRNEPIPQIQME